MNALTEGELAIIALSLYIAHELKAIPPEAYPDLKSVAKRCIRLSGNAELKADMQELLLCLN